MVLANPFRTGCALLPNPKITTSAQWLAYEIEAWCAATLTGGLLIANVPEHLREFVVDLRNRRLTLVNAIGRIQPEGVQATS